MSLGIDRLGSGGERFVAPQEIRVFAKGRRIDPKPGDRGGYAVVFARAIATDDFARKQEEARGELDRGEEQHSQDNAESQLCEEREDFSASRTAHCMPIGLGPHLLPAAGSVRSPDSSHASRQWNEENHSDMSVLNLYCETTSQDAARSRTRWGDSTLA